MKNITLEIDLNDELTKKSIAWDGPSKIKINRRRAYWTFRKRGIKSTLQTRVDITGFDNQYGRLVDFIPEELEQNNGHFLVVDKEVRLKLWVSEAELLREWKDHKKPEQLLIPFEVSVVIDGKIVKSDYKQYQLEVNFKKAYAKNDLQFSIDPEFDKEKILYRMSKKELGAIYLHNRPDDLFAHTLSLKQVVIFLKDDEYEYRDAVEIKTLENTQQEGKDRDGFYLNDLSPGEQKKFDLTIDLSKVPQPIVRKTYQVELHGLQNLGNGSFEQMSYELFSFDMEMDKTETDLWVGYNVPKSGEFQFTKVVGTKNVQLNHDWVYNLGKPKDEEIVCEIRLRNNATSSVNGNAGIRIRNVKMSFALESIYNNPFPEGKTINDVLECHLPKGELFLANKPDSKYDLQFGYKNVAFSVLKNQNLENKMLIIGTLQYDYCIINDDRIEQTPKDLHKKHNFKFSIRQYEGANWTILDLGTSAHVLIKQEVDKSEIVDMQFYLKELFTKNYDKIQEEKGTPFLSSTTVLDLSRARQKDNTYLIDNFAKWQKHYLSLSPPLFDDEAFKILPSIKFLIATEELPKAVLETEEEDERSSLEKLTSTDILESTYSLLVNHFVRRPDLNKIILTIPNIFTGIHKQVLRNTIHKVLGNVWDNYIRFIRESDAVAWYYTRNRTPLLENYSSIKGKKKEVENRIKIKTENVLVYDVGAGTIDLTLFNISYGNDGSMSVKVMGRVGNAMGGNYLDFLLAKEMLPGGMSLTDDLDSAFLLPYKKYIKNVVKPHLGKNSGTLKAHSVKYINKTIEIPVEKFPNVVSTLKSQNGYFYEISHELLRLLANNCTEKVNKIDVVMFAGRGSQIPFLRKQVINYSKQWFPSSENIVTIMPKTEKLKTAVAEGAAGLSKFMDAGDKFQSLAIAARFGLLLYKFDGSLDYLELVSPKSELQDIEVNQEAKRGVQVEKVFPLINVERVAFIQTFEDENRIKELAKNEAQIHNRATFLGQFTKDESFQQTNKGMILLKVYDDGEVDIKFNSKRPPAVTSRSFDLEKNEIYQRSMWPFIKPTK